MSARRVGSAPNRVTFAIEIAETINWLATPGALAMQWFLLAAILLCVALYLRRLRIRRARGVPVKRHLTVLDMLLPPSGRMPQQRHPGSTEADAEEINSGK